MTRTKVLLATTLSFCTAVSAHHSTNVAFDFNNIGTVEGTVTSVFWRNPHVLLTVERVDENGRREEWKIESGSPNSLQRIGIGADIVAVGDRVGLIGALSRRGLTSMAAVIMVLEDGREVTLWPQRAETIGRAVAVDTRALISRRAAEQSRREAEGIFRVWSRTEWFEWTLPFTAEAAAARGSWDPLIDDPALQCVAPGMPSMMDNPYPIEFVDQGEQIVLRLEEWDGERTIHMIDGSGAAARPAVPTGFSTGRWDGSTLVVTTTRVSYPYFDADGTPQSAAIRIVERFTLSDDQRRLDYQAQITDPETFTEPASVRGFWVWVPGEQIKAFNCALPDQGVSP